MHTISYRRMKMSPNWVLALFVGFCSAGKNQLKSICLLHRMTTCFIGHSVHQYVRDCTGRKWIKDFVRGYDQTGMIQSGCAVHKKDMRGIDIPGRARDTMYCSVTVNIFMLSDLDAHTLVTTITLRCCRPLTHCSRP